MTTLTGKVSWFGGPEDTGVSPNEGLAFIYEVSDAPWLFLPEQPPGTSGLARRLDPSIHYIACRWDYNQTPKSMLPGMVVQVRSTRTGRTFKAFPADWGPHVDTDRVADISPGLMEALGIQTDDEVEVYFPYHEAIEEMPMPYPAIVISSGHGKYVRGASGILDEVDEARKVVERLADELGSRGVEVTTFHDDTSHSQDENLHTIVAFHNAEDARPGRVGPLQRLRADQQANGLRGPVRDPVGPGVPGVRRDRRVRLHQPGRQEALGPVLPQQHRRAGHPAGGLLRGLVGRCRDLPRPVRADL